SFDALDTRDLSETPPTPPSSFQARPVDRGFTAWLQVLGASLLFLNAWGLVSAFGTFQTYYHVILLAGTSNASIVSIGSLAGFLLCATPLAWNIIFGGEGVRLPMRLLLLIGSMLTVLGLFLTSLCTTLWQFLLTQAVCCGLGSGCLFLVAASILPSYFVRRRALALGLAASGSGVGGIVYPLVFRSLLPRFGFAWSVRAVAMVALVTLVIPCIILRQRPSPDTQPHPQSDDDEETPSPPRRSLHITCTALLKDRAYLAFNTATFFSFAGAYIPFFFIEQHAARHGMPLSGSMLLFLHIGSIPGTLLPALLANRREDRQNFLHPVYLFSGLSGSAALLAFLWAGIPARATALLAVWCVLFGFCMGACAGLQGAVLASLTPIEASGNFFAGALGLLVGGPVAGLMVGRAWIYAQVFCGVMLAFATIAV
ncbi:MFS general substrate transporter, partial [Dissoconium aciculare CBS 342.82]|uniref:MFS general substrate transporter n=1 Tax=Dissoconium aciculare CBS 342.82 TaxID=1314786 RepID=A0A6J3LXN3_9PEZI